MPASIPGAVLAHAATRMMSRRLPSRMVADYWHVHPLRADRLARALAALNGSPLGWTWRIAASGEKGLPRSFRTPPTPFREPGFHRGPGYCCVCGQPVYRYGWHRDLWLDGNPNRRASWHACCVAAWILWNAPAGQAALLRRLQARRCRETGRRLLRSAEVDHQTPLFKVWRDYRNLPWPQLLTFWGGPNLQVINRQIHVAKCAAEAGDRASARAAA